MRNGLLVAGMALAVLALAASVVIAHGVAPTSVLAQERQNCPSGFIWDRLSGIGCVQEALPANAHYSYEGYSICYEGYTGEYERRNTTDGQPAPGTPYTSFAYLLSCRSGAAAGGGGFSGFAGDVADRLYDSGGAPSPETLAATGAIVAGAATLAAAGGRITGGWGRAGSLDAKTLSWYDRKIAELNRAIAKAEQELAEAEKLWEATRERLKDVQRVLDSLKRQSQSLRELMEQARLNARDLDQAFWLRVLAAVIGGPLTVAQIATWLSTTTLVTSYLPVLARAVQAIKAPVLAAKVEAAIAASKAPALITAFRWISGAGSWAHFGASAFFGWGSSKPWHTLQTAYKTQLQSLEKQQATAEQLNAKLQDAFKQKNQAQHELMELTRQRDQLAEWRRDFTVKSVPWGP